MMGHQIKEDDMYRITIEGHSGFQTFSRKFAFKVARICLDTQRGFCVIKRTHGEWRQIAEVKPS
jgi:hypothetical protein